MVSSLNRVT